MLTGTDNQVIRHSCVEHPIFSVRCDIGKIGFHIQSEPYQTNSLQKI